nr:hypothetical protein [Myxococcota bacterium]
GQGEACSGGGECRSGFGCYQPNGGAAYCVEKCSTSSDCDSGLSCVAIGSGSGAASVCLERRAPAPIPTGEPDVEDDDSGETSKAGCSVAGPSPWSSSPSHGAEALAVLGALALVSRRRGGDEPPRRIPSGGGRTG